MKIVIDTSAGTLTRVADGVESSTGLFTREAFEAISREWVRVGWSLRYYHNFSWFGHPVLQMPEDMLRLQEVIYAVRPKTIVETGVFRGGSLLFYATLFEAMGEGHAIGIDREIPGHLREAIGRHPLGGRITLIEGDSAAQDTVAQVAARVGDGPVLVMLDSCHTKAHVAKELECYAPLVTKGSYIVAADGVMKDLTDVPGGEAGWSEDNPMTAATEFAARHAEFQQGQPPWLFHDGELTENVTYWPGAWLKRIA